jgi:hypothetical protein
LFDILPGHPTTEHLPTKKSPSKNRGALINMATTYSPVPHVRECSTIVRPRRINFSVSNSLNPSLKIEHCTLIIEHFLSTSNIQHSLFLVRYSSWSSHHRTLTHKKKPLEKSRGSNKYGNYLLSRILVQYHWP